VESQSIDEKEALVETVLLGLRKTEGIDTRLLPERVRAAMKKTVEEIVSHGLAELHRNRLRLTRRGLLLSNEIMARLLSVL
jgi:oxygen-independent coproporphyrinogen-3 oxidase